MNQYVGQHTANDAAYLLNVVETGGTNDDGVAKLALHQAVVRHPAQRDLRQRQPVLRRDRLDLVESAEVRLVPVPDPVHLALSRVWVEAGARLAAVLEEAVATREEASADCVSIVLLSSVLCQG